MGGSWVKFGWIIIVLHWVCSEKLDFGVLDGIMVGMWGSLLSKFCSVQDQYKGRFGSGLFINIGSIGSSDEVDGSSTIIVLVHS